MKILPTQIFQMNLKSQIKRTAMPAIVTLSGLMISSCSYSKPYNECTKQEADSIYRQEHAQMYANFALLPGNYNENELRKQAKTCPCSSCDSMNTEFAKKDSIAINRENFLKTYHNDLLERTLKRTINIINKDDAVLSIDDLNNLEYVDENKCVVKDEDGEVIKQLSLSKDEDGKYAFLFENLKDDIKGVFAFNKDHSYMDYIDAQIFTSKNNAIIYNPLSNEFKKSMATLLNSVNHNIEDSINIFITDNSNSFKISSNGRKRKYNNIDKTTWKSKLEGVKIKLEIEKNGDYSLSYIVGNTIKGDILISRLYFTKDHQIQNDAFLTKPRDIADPSLAADQGGSDLASINLFEDVNLQALQKIASSIGIKDVEYLDKGSGVYNLFLKSGNIQYDVIVKKANDDGLFTGIAKKLLSSGSSEIYIFQSEHFSTNKTDKVRISKMRVIQDGITDASPTKKKYDKETRRILEDEQTNSHSLDGKSRTNMWFAFISNWFHPGKNYSGKLISKNLSKINEIISDGNAEGRIITVYSCPKNSDIVECNGQIVTK